MIIFLLPLYSPKSGCLFLCEQKCQGQPIYLSGLENQWRLPCDYFSHGNWALLGSHLNV